MNVVSAVIVDLYRFAFVYWFGFRPSQPKALPLQLTADTGAEHIPPKTMQEVRSNVTPVSQSDALVRVKRATATLLDRVGYITAPLAYLYVLPTRTFDGAIRRLSYGQSFIIIGQQGRWLQVRCGDESGWIEADVVTERESALRPQFREGVLYDSVNQETKKLRAVIDDQFHASKLDMPLQNVEYVTYRLQEKGEPSTGLKRAHVSLVLGSDSFVAYAAFIWA